MTQAALSMAEAESAQLFHSYIGCEHLLLGLAAEPDGLAGQVLRGVGIELRVARRAVTTALSGCLHARQTEAAPPTRIDEILLRLEAIERRLPA